MCDVVCVVDYGAVSMVYGGVCAVTNIESSSGVIMAESCSLKIAFL